MIITASLPPDRSSSPSLAYLSQSSSKAEQILRRGQSKTTSSKNSGNRKATLPTKESLEQLKVNDRQSLLRKEGLPVSGRKSDLIERSANPLYRGPKPKAWQYSDTKKDLKQELLKPSSPLHSMTAKEVQNTNKSFKFPLHQQQPFTMPPSFTMPSPMQSTHTPLHWCPPSVPAAYPPSAARPQWGNFSQFAAPCYSTPTQHRMLYNATPAFYDRFGRMCSPPVIMYPR